MSVCYRPPSWSLSCKSASGFDRWVGLHHAAPPSADRQLELVRMVRQDCGSCTAYTLTGDLGPAPTREALVMLPLEPWHQRSMAVAQVLPWPMEITC